MLREAALIATMRAGNPDAFTEIVEWYQPSIIRYLYRLTGDFAMAQDLAQDTFIQAYKAILKTNSDLQLKAWLYRIATNNAFSYQRRRKILSFIPFSRFVQPPEIQENTAEHAGEKLAIQESLRKVPAEQRTCLILHFVEGFKYREIAETLSISEEAVRKRVARGKQVFKQAYGGGEV